MKRFKSFIFLFVLSAIMPLMWLNAAEQKPNVVFLIVDDFGSGALNFRGNTYHETPNMDALYSEGTYFRFGYSACTVCSPSRAAIMTGKAPARLHLTDWIAGFNRPDAKLLIPDWKMYMEHSETTLPEAFKENGYSTAFFGKWHLMPEEDPIEMKNHYPTNHGFDINIGGREWGQPKGEGRYFYPYDMPGLEEGEEGEFLTDRLTDEAINYMDTAKSKPFLLYMSYYTVHTPLMATPEMVQKYTAKMPNATSDEIKFAGMVELLDNSVGDIVSYLKTNNMWDNTIFVFTADNGPLKNKYTYGARGNKGLSYDGGTREPFIICGPGIPKNVENETPVIGMDLYPTLLELCGLDLKPEQHVDGVSLASLLLNNDTIADRALYWHYPHYHKTTPYSAIQYDGWKLIEFHENNGLQLYNVKNDYREGTNLVTSEIEIRDKLVKMLHDWRDSVGAQMPVPNPNYDDGSGTGTGTGEELVTPPAPWSHDDIGAVGQEGDAGVEDGIFTLLGSGADIWSTKDEFHFLYQPMSGDGSIVAKIESIQNGDDGAKAGVMIRESLDLDAPYAMTLLTAKKGSRFFTRVAKGGTTASIAGATVLAPYWVRLVRNGNAFLSYISEDGSTWELVGSKDLVMDAEVFIGLAVSSHKDGVLCTGTFSSVEVDAGNVSALDEKEFVPVSLFPNPTDGIVTIDVSSLSGKVQVRIFDMQSKEILSQSCSASQTTINISAFDIGTYLVETSTDNAINVQKLVLM